MDMSSIIERVKPYGFGFIAGIVLAPIVMFASGWVVSSDAMESAVKRANVSGYATVCADAARSQWTDGGKTLADLDGYAHYEERETLATDVVKAMPVPEALSNAVIDACSSKIAT